MPYRRLPNTDNARLRALKTALHIGKETPPFKLAFRQSTLSQIECLLPNYENSLCEHRNAYGLHLEKSKEQNKAMKKARIYVSHFIQVINMSIQRGDLSKNVRKQFGLEDFDKKMPSLSTDEEILSWGDILISGEQKRQMKGLNPITNPTIAVVKVHCEIFRDAKTDHESIKKRLGRSQESITGIRAEADTLIQKLWNEIEASFKNLPDDLRRKKSSEYGIVYVFRKNELDGSKLLKLSELEAG